MICSINDFQLLSTYSEYQIKKNICFYGITKCKYSFQDLHMSYELISLKQIPSGMGSYSSRQKTGAVNSDF